MKKILSLCIIEPEEPELEAPEWYKRHKSVTDTVVIGNIKTQAVLFIEIIPLFNTCIIFI